MGLLFVSRFHEIEHLGGVATPSPASTNIKLLYIQQYFVTNEGTSGTHSYDVSKYWVQIGDVVHLVADRQQAGAVVRARDNPLAAELAAEDLGMRRGDILL